MEKENFGKELSKAKKEFKTFDEQIAFIEGVSWYQNREVKK